VFVTERWRALISFRVGAAMMRLHPLILMSAQASVPRSIVVARYHDWARASAPQMQHPCTNFSTEASAEPSRT
jgi:hypothetical protein